MSSDPHASAQQNGRPARGAPVIRATALQADNAPRDFKRLIPAVIVSCSINALIMVALLYYNFPGAEGAQPVPTEKQVIEAPSSTDDPQDLNLTNEDLGLNPELETNYNNTRIEEFSVPGPVDPAANIGILNAPEGPPQTLPPPPGLGNGSGGGIESSTQIGRGNTMGVAGGQMGLRMMPGGFGGRSGSTKQQMLTSGGGNTESERAVALGLAWLAKHQAPDGHWGLNDFSTHGKCNCGDAGRQHDIAGTGFGLLPFLGAGETHKPPVGGKVQKYEKNVEKGLKYLLLKQNREGDFGGGMYSHGIASIAVCEAYGVTADPMLKGPAQKAVNFIVAAQNQIGGWDYTAKGATPDTSVSGWNVQALKSGQMGGLVVPKETLAQANKYLDAWAGDAYGASYGYRSPGSRPSTNAIGLLCRQYLGWGPRNPGLVKGVEGLQRISPNEANKHMYYYYYATQVLHHMGGQAWKTWNPKMRDMLIKLQDDGSDANRRHQKGSWSSAGWDVGGYGGGRIMLTSMALLTLEVYYRHLPLYRREMGGNKDTGVKDGL